MKKRKKSSGPKAGTLEAAVDACVRRVANPKEREAFRSVLTDLVRNNAIPVELLKDVPVKAAVAGKSRFDQIYDAAMFLAFPGYVDETLEKLLGPGAEEGRQTKIWRAMFPPKFRMSHVLLRAPDFQTAFALGCDYACRASLRTFKRIPSDLTVRIQFVSEKAVRRMLQLRWANRMKKRRQLQLVGREYSPKEIAGARIVAVGTPRDSGYSVFRYAEKKDLGRIGKSHGRTRTSLVETETFRPRET